MIGARIEAQLMRSIRLESALNVALPGNRRRNTSAKGSQVVVEMTVAVAEAMAWKAQYALSKLYTHKFVCSSTPLATQFTALRPVDAWCGRRSCRSLRLVAKVRAYGGEEDGCEASVCRVILRSVYARVNPAGSPGLP